MPIPVTSATNPGRSWYRLSESYGTKVSLSQAIRTAVIDTERETRTNEENFQ